MDVTPPASFFRKHKYANFNYDLAKNTEYANTDDPYPKRDPTEIESFARVVFREPVETPKPRTKKTIDSKLEIQIEAIQNLDESTIDSYVLENC